MSDTPEENPKWTNEELKWAIESEGLDYAVCHYLGADKIENQEVAALWEAARVAMEILEAKLKELGIMED